MEPEDKKSSSPFYVVFRCELNGVRLDRIRMEVNKKVLSFRSTVDSQLILVTIVTFVPLSLSLSLLLCSVLLCSFYVLFNIPFCHIFLLSSLNLLLSFFPTFQVLFLNVLFSFLIFFFLSFQ